MNNNLHNFLVGKGAALVGFADISSMPMPAGFNQFPYAVSAAVNLQYDIVEDILIGPFEQYCREYSRTMALLKELSFSCEDYIQSMGYRAYGLTGSRIPYSSDTCTSAFPHKTAARLAGLGWIGKNALLITKEFGAAQMLTTILTDLPLKTGTPSDKPLCAACTKCRDICPGEAIKGTLWTENTSRKEIIDVCACEDAVAKRGQHLSIKDVTCGLCIAACPYTQNYIKNGKTSLSHK